MRGKQMKTDYPTDEELEDMAKSFDDYTLVNINAPF